MTKKTLFITRELTDATWLQPLELSGWRVCGRSFVHFKPIPFTEVPAVDWIAFYSPNGVHHFLSQVENMSQPHFYRAGDFFKNISRRISISALGPGTARTIAEWGLHIDHAGNGQPLTWAHELATLAGTSKILVPRGTNSRQVLRQILDSGIGQFDLIDLPVYKNEPVENPPVIEESFILFTSSLNVKAYLAHHKMRSDQVLFAIGANTLTTIREYGYDAIQVPTPDISLICSWIAGNFPKPATDS